MQPKSSFGQQASPATASNSSATEKRDKQTRGEIENRSPASQAGAAAAGATPLGDQQKQQQQQQPRRERSFGLLARADKADSLTDSSELRTLGGHHASSEGQRSIVNDANDRRGVPRDQTQQQQQRQQVSGAQLSGCAEGTTPRPQGPAGGEAAVITTNNRNQVKAGQGAPGRRISEQALGRNSLHTEEQDSSSQKQQPEQPPQKQQQQQQQPSRAASCHEWNTQAGQQEQQRPTRTTSADERGASADSVEALRLPEQKVQRQSSAPASEQQRVATFRGDNCTRPASRQQRIKVTLSRPRTESSEEPPSETQQAPQPVQPLVHNRSPALQQQQQQQQQQPRQSSPSHLSESSSLVSFAFGHAARTRGPSTATLISGSIEQIAGQPIADEQLEERAPADRLSDLVASDRPGEQSLTSANATSTTSSGLPAVRLSRTEQENQLRRIASQRRRIGDEDTGRTTNEPKLTTGGPLADQTQRRSPTSTTTARAAGEPSATNARAPLTLESSERKNFLLSTPTGPFKQEAASCTTGGAAQAPREKGGPPESCTSSLNPTKQLAIYINGKVRSNSIFCSRSVSSNSFTGILKSHFNSTPNATNNKASVRVTNTSKTEAQQHSASRKAADATTATCADDHSDDEGQEGAAATGKHGFVTDLLPGVCCGQTRQSRLVQLGRRTRREAAGTNGGRRLLNWLHLADLNSDLWPEVVRDHCCSKSTADQKSLEVHHECDQTAEGHSDDEPADANDTQEPELKTYKLNPSSMFLRKAMRYYRLWIYSANLIILLGTIIFVLSALYVTSDYRFQLVVGPAVEHQPAAGGGLARDNTNNSLQIPSASKGHGHEYDDAPSGRARPLSKWRQETDGRPPEVEQISLSIGLSEPVMVLAYLMIAVQLGVLQAIGCFGAIRMKERLIQAFWYLILGLILVDVVILVYWLQRYDVILKSLRREMTTRLNLRYGHPPLLPNDTLGFRLEMDKTFTRIMDEIQAGSRCCGVGNSLDYKQTEWRRAKVAQLEKRLHERERQMNATGQQPMPGGDEMGPGPSLEHILGQLALVPASCCRRAEPKTINPTNKWPASAADSDKSEHWLVRNEQTSPTGRYNTKQVGPPTGDDLPGSGKQQSAWWPSSTIGERVNEADDNDGQGGGTIAAEVDVRTSSGDNGRRPTLADVIDRRWNGLPLGLKSASMHDDDDDDDEEGRPPPDGLQMAPGDDNGAADNEDDEDETRPPYSNKRARLMTKEMHYDSSETAATNSERRARRTRRALSSLSGPQWRPTAAPSAANDESQQAERPPTQAQEGEIAADDEDDDDDDDDDGGDDADADGEEDNREDYNVAERQIDDVRRAGGNISSSSGDGWAVESKLDQRGRVLSRLIEIIDASEKTRRQPVAPHNATMQDRRQLDDGTDKAHSWATQLHRLRQLLFVRVASDDNNDGGEGAEPTERFIWPNELGLDLVQFKLLESYLSEQIKQANGGGSKLRRRSISNAGSGRRDSTTTTTASRLKREQQQATPMLTKSSSARQNKRVELIRELVVADEQLGCLARTHYDEARIYTRGCHPHIKAWLQSSANVLFITGFCVLTVLKFCSLILLRLEIREMIHKIRVLRGMATEYNALQDLEPYLPRSSVCAQAAELTPTGVSPALGGPTTAGMNSPTGMNGAAGGGTTAPGSTNQMAAGGCGSPTTCNAGGMAQVPRRLGGSFSEAVAAAAAVAHQQRMVEQQQQQLQRHLRDYERATSLANCARAASTRTIVGGSGAPSCSCAAASSLAGGAVLNAPSHGIGGSLCPCSTSMSVAAHLNHSANQLTAGGVQQQHKFQQNAFRSDLFPAGLASMPRRHTAVSVCPAAAAAAAAAAHHLMIRRGTFAIANPLTFSACGQQQSYQGSAGGGLGALSVACANATRQSTSSMLQAKSLNYLNQHRHSAHAVPPSQLLFRSSGGNANFLLPSASKPAHLRRPSSLFAPEEPPLRGRKQSTSNQLDPAGPQSGQSTFRRQVSGGAQSAVNFSLDIAPVQYTESRRSIH